MPGLSILLALGLLAPPDAVMAAARPQVADPFPERAHVTLDELVAALEDVAEAHAANPAVRADYLALVAAHGLADSLALYRDYVRVKLLFEATRGGGLWHLKWDITNREPNSEAIWAQWRALDEAPDPGRAAPTAIAECDELSALFAFFARRLGVRGVGLLWPVWNHVVAVWTVPGADGGEVRVVVPTSQVLLDSSASLGTDGFDPRRQRKIYEYRRRDASGETRLDAELARFMVAQLARHGGRPQAELQRERNARDQAMEITAPTRR